MTARPGAALCDRYGRWALVTGAAEGLGAAFARALAEEGQSLLLVDRKGSRLAETAQSVKGRSAVETRTLVADLSTRAGVDAVLEAAKEVEVGLVVCSAGLSLVGPFLNQAPEALEEVLSTNCRAPLLLCHGLGRSMAARGRGGIVLVSSLSAFQGTGLVVAYAATKAFDLVLGEGLWEELRQHGVDVLSLCLGPTRTPGWERSRPRQTLHSQTVMEPDVVVAEALSALGRTGPTAVVGRTNRLAAFVATRLLSRRAAVLAMARATRSLYESDGGDDGDG
jgi:short-subunit dehydrogenase